jgi:hypothetical protein
MILDKKTGMRTHPQEVQGKGEAQKHLSPKAHNN